MLFFLSMALAADATRCVANWTGPAEGCVVSGNYSAEATASTRKGAERAALAQLATVLELSGRAKKMATPALSDTDFAGCKQQAAEAYVSCFSEPKLMTEDAFCFAVLDAPECWTGQVLNYQDDAWRVLGTARKEVCEKVDAYLVAQNYNNLEQRRADCAAICQAKLKVSCP